MLDASDQAEETLSSVMELGGVELAHKNVSLFLHPELIDEGDPEYRQFLADVWVGIVLSLMVLVCVCCMCSCLLYHKFQQWKRSVLDTRTPANVEAGNPELESLPSYTIVSGLPSYEEALQQLKKIKEVNNGSTKSPSASDWVPRTPPTPVQTLSVIDLFQKHKTEGVKPS